MRPPTTVRVEESTTSGGAKVVVAGAMVHTFRVEVLACAPCGGRMRVVAAIDDPVVIRRIFTHLGLPTAAPPPRPPPADLFG